MGTKISAMTLTGSAPSASYVPLAYDGKNYKIDPENFAGGGAGKAKAVSGTVTSSTSWRTVLIGDLGSEDVLTVSAAFCFRNSLNLTWNATINGSLAKTAGGYFNSCYFVGGYLTYRVLPVAGEGGGVFTYNGGGVDGTSFGPNSTDGNYSTSLYVSSNKLYWRWSQWPGRAGSYWATYLTHGN